MSIRTAIIGPTGYTGLHLIELLLRHPEAEVSYLASARDKLPVISDEFPQLFGRCDLACRPADPKAIAEEADVAFACLPHKAAMAYIPQLLEAGMRVVDLSADYRLRDADLYEKVYATEHTDRANLADAVYGLPEVFPDDIADADLIANPGCYPTAAGIAIAPLLERSLVKIDPIIINAASGVTGAGRAAKPHLHFPEVQGGYFPYGCGDHRHQPEIEQTLSTIKAQPVSALFVPHLLPIDRGIFQTIYLEPLDDEVTEDDLWEAYHDAYDDEPFVRLRTDRRPNVKYVRDTNFCDLHVKLVEVGHKIIVVCFGLMT
ncbi:MAG: N-acetyl-gamma-glutamyl-phosphate reductase, partial [Phycisphaeraceae bacterium]